MLRPATTRVASHSLTRPRVSASTFFLFASILTGAAVRARPVLAADFPLNDGGMFYTIIRDVERAGLPLALSYNGLALPFAYPPLAFILAALADSSGIPLTDVLRLLPWLFASLGVVAFARLARVVLGDGVRVAIATFAFAAVPASYTWLVMGGGLTRSLGFCLALVALERVATYLETRSRAALLGVALASGLAGLSHLEAAWFIVFSAGVLWAWRGRDRASLRGLALAAAGALCVCAPWLVWTLAQYGAGPLVAAAGTGALDNPVLDLAVFRPTSEPWFAMLAGLAVLGAVRAIGRREWALPAWVVAIALLDSRSFGTLASVPLALLAASAVRDVIAPLVPGTRLRIAMGAIAITYVLVAATQAEPELLRAVPASDRAAMAWARDATPSDARFVVVTERGWAENAPGEWFPALAARRSVSTVQGYEWLPDRAFWRQMRAFFAAQSCGSRDASCLDALRDEWAMPFDYVYLPAAALERRQDSSDAPCCGALRESLVRDPRYELVYAQDGAMIFRVR